MTTRKKAKTIDSDEFKLLLDKVTNRSRRPKVDRAFFLLSYRAGLRVQEIAGLEWGKHVFSATGKFTSQKRMGRDGKTRTTYFLTIDDNIGKFGRGRVLAMADDLYAALLDLWNDPDRDPSPFVIPPGNSRAGSGLKSRANALRTRINRMYAEMGFNGCTTHSGRRTLITNIARRANSVGAHLGDVQKIAGHRNLSTTEEYLDASDSQVDLLTM